MPNDFDGKPCKYGVAASGYCNKKPKRPPAAKRPCKYGRRADGFCNDRPADGRYGTPEPTDSLTGVASNNPPETITSVVKTAASEIQKKGGLQLGDKGWAVIFAVIAGSLTFAAMRRAAQDDRALAAKFAARELQRVQRALGRLLSEKEAATLTAQYLTFALQKFNDARNVDSKRPQDREKAFAGLEFRRSLGSL